MKVLLVSSLLLYLRASNAQEISAECKAESSILEATPKLEQELSRLEAAVASVPFQTFCAATTIALSCIINYDDFPHSVSEICDELGGKYLESSFTVNCLDNGTRTITGSSNIPSCLAQSCDADTIDASIDKQFLETEADYESRGLECEVNFDNEDPNGGAKNSGVTTKSILSVFVASIVAISCLP
jgi:hypothetical protein